MIGWSCACILRDMVNERFKRNASRRMGKGVQQNLFKRVMNAPINLFFDITPIGKIFERFNSDIDVFKGRIFDGFCHLVGMLTWPMCILAYISTVSIWTVPFFMCLVYGMLQVGKPYLLAVKKMEKIEEKMNHPHHGSKESALRGMSVIRAFNKTGDF